MQNIKQHRPLCLASSSVRRQELLDRYQLEFSIQVPNIVETPNPTESPREYVQRLSIEKANAVEVHESEIILAGDTTVVCNHQILEKPSTDQEALAMLQTLSGNTHHVFSGYCILDSASQNMIHEVAHTQVKFRTIPKEWLLWYVQTGDPFDKAGGYSIQGLGGIFIQEIQGSYNTVVGFPIEDIFWHLHRKGWISC